uniref:Secreted protein n=1 Tax=Aegilops tauschii subsp. strangulata TaxID=200361 RepID=A0A453H752_AEGTS
MFTSILSCELAYAVHTIHSVLSQARAYCHSITQAQHEARRARPATVAADSSKKQSLWCWRWRERRWHYQVVSQGWKLGSRCRRWHPAQAASFKTTRRKVVFNSMLRQLFSDGGLTVDARDGRVAFHIGCAGHWYWWPSPLTHVPSERVSV